MPDMVLLKVKNFPAGLRQQIKVVAAQRGMPMREVIIEACQRACAEAALDLPGTDGTG